MPPRTLSRIAMALVALLLAWQAQDLLPEMPLASALLYAAAIALFLGALSHLQVASLARSAEAITPAESLGRSQWTGLALALLLSFVSAVFFGVPTAVGSAWLLHLLAVAAFAGSFVRLSRPAMPEWAPVVRSRWFALLALLLLAAVPRLWQIDQFPEGTWYDEAFNGIAASRMVEDPSYRPVFVESDTLPAHFTYLLALSFRIFGVSTTAMRLVSAVFGVAGALLAYLLFRRLFGDPVGWVAGAFVAVMRFDLTLSRIALHGITTPFFELLALLFLVRILERRRLADVGWLALVLGFGLAFYAPFRLFPFALGAVSVGLVGIAALRVWRCNSRSSLMAMTREWRGFAAPALFVLLVGVVVATAPILQFALQNSQQFFARTASVSIFERRDEQDLRLALWNNFSKHMLMFNVQGDRNGRHNLPNAPLLDPLMGALAVIGFALAIRRSSDPPNLMMLVFFFVMNLGGILTVDFEAPQSLRSVGVLPAVVYFAVLPLAALRAELERVFSRPRARPVRPASAAPLFQLFSAGLAILVGASGYTNFQTFFGIQRNSPEVWAAHSGAESVAARTMNELAADFDLIVTALWANHPTLRFLAPAVRDYESWTVSDRLPLVREGGRGVAFVLDPLLKSTYDAARTYYPTADFRELKPPGGRETAVYVVALAADDVSSVQGLTARYYRGEGFDGTPVREFVTSNPLFDWRDSAPLTGTFSVEWRGTLFVAASDRYRLRLDGAPAAAIWLDEYPVSEAQMVLAKGNHALRIRVKGSPSSGVLQWQPSNATRFEPIPPSLLFHAPVGNNGLLGAYFRNAVWSGTPDFLQVDPEISLYFHNIPLPRPYSIEWNGKVYAPVAGLYRFATESRDESQVVVNGQLVVSNGGGGALVDGATQLVQGWHNLQVRFADHTSHTHIQLYWVPPGGSRETVPSRYLLPPMGKYPTAAELAAMSGPATIPPAPGNRPTGGGPVAALVLEPTAVIGEPGSGPGQFREPRAVAVGGDGRLYVADSGNRRVQILGPDGSFIATMDGGEQPFVEPFDLVLLPDGTLVVLDSAEGWLYRFDRSGKPQGRIGGPQERFFHPRGLSADSAGNLLVADTGGSRIVKLASDGRRLQVVGAKGNGKGQFVEPSDAALDAGGYLFATDVPNRRVEVFAGDGRFVLEFGIPLANPFNGPHLAFAPDGSLLVTAPETHRIQRYARDGTLLGEWGTPGAALGQLRMPTGITVHRNTVWIADTGNHRIQQWNIK